MNKFINKLLYLHPGEFRRLLPFFVLCLIVHTMLNISEGASVALFLEHLGASGLPKYYTVTAISSFIFVCLYMIIVDKISHTTIFCLILGLSITSFLISWGSIEFLGHPGWAFGLFYVTREVSFMMIGVHFGNYILDYFTREELHRILPIIYSAVRIGGIIGGIVLTFVTHTIGALNLLFVSIFVGLLGVIYLFVIGKNPKIEDKEDEKSVKQVSIPEFFHFFINSKFLMTFTLSSFLFIILSNLINFQYSRFFEIYFGNADYIAVFIGKYSIIALFISLVIQIFVVNRAVEFIGLKGSHFLYSVLLFIATSIMLFPFSLTGAVYCLFINKEFKAGFRLALLKLIGNKFAKNVRSKSRALSIGIVTPAGYLIGSWCISLLTKTGNLSLIPAVSFLLFLGYTFISIEMYRYFTEKPLILSYLHKYRLNFMERFFQTSR